MSAHHQLFNACAEGDLQRVRELHEAVSSSPEEETALVQQMILKAAEKGHAHVVRYCLERGAECSDAVINEATTSPEVFKVLVENGGLDINEDWETAGDMLINAVWQLQVSQYSIHAEYPICLVRLTQ